MKRVKKYSLATVFYIVAIISLIYATYQVLSTYNYIADLVSTQQLVLNESWSQVITYVFDNCFSYIFYGLVLLFCGRTLDEPVVVEQKVEKEVIEPEPVKVYQKPIKKASKPKAKKSFVRHFESSEEEDINKNMKKAESRSTNTRTNTNTNNNTNTTRTRTANNNTTRRPTFDDDIFSFQTRHHD